MNYEKYFMEALFIMLVLYVVYHVDAVRDLVMGA